MPGARQTIAGGSHTKVWFYIPMLDGGPSFEWDEVKDSFNIAKYGVGFGLAQRAFLDPKRII